MAEQKEYTTHKYSLSIIENDRKDYRQSLARVFLAEDPGSGNKGTRYLYAVEKDSVGGKRVILTHPAPLNKGFDFQVHIEGHEFLHLTKDGKTRKTNTPLHQDIIDDLLAKRGENQLLFKGLRPLLDKVFNCETIDDAEFVGFHFTSGLSVELLFKTIKWLFIEQDITYWNWSGREMLYNALIPLWEPTLFEQQLS